MMKSEHPDEEGPSSKRQRLSSPESHLEGDAESERTSSEAAVGPEAQRTGSDVMSGTDVVGTEIEAPAGTGNPWQGTDSHASEQFPRPGIDVPALTGSEVTGTSTELSEGSGTEVKVPAGELSNDHPPGIETPGTVTGVHDQMPQEPPPNVGDPNVGIPTPSSRSTSVVPDLSERLHHLMLCNVCCEVPHPEESYQCSQGHIVCLDCMTHILAEAAISRKDARCPHCRVRISWNELGQSLVLRQALWELSTSCPQCGQQVPLKTLPLHLEGLCEQRQVRCQYHCLGCDWKGAHAESDAHEMSCQLPSKGGLQILELLEAADLRQRKRQRQVVRIHQELSALRIFYQNVELSWCNEIKLNETGTERSLESKLVYAFEEQWKLCLRLNIPEDDSPRQLSYMLKLPLPPRQAMEISYFAQMPVSQVAQNQAQDIRPELYKRTFTAQQNGVYRDLPLHGSMALYHLMAMPNICLRLWMFLH